MRHGVGSDRGEIDHHAALGQHRIERLDHIDHSDRVDFNDIFCCRVAWRNAGGVDDLRHVTERCSIVCQCLHLCAVRDVCFAEIALHAKLVQLRFCRFHLCKVTSRQHDHGRFSEFLADCLSHAAVTACHDRNCVIPPDLDTAQAALYGPPVLCFHLYALRSTSSRRRI